MEENKKVFYITISLGFSVFIIMLLVAFFTTSGSKKPAAVVPYVVDTVKNSKIEVKYNGSLELKSNKPEYKKGEKITIKVVGNSDSQSVMGYDVVLNYDPLKIKYMGNQSLDKDFQVIAKNNKGILKATGFKSGDVVKVLNASDLLNLDFASISTGQADLKFTFVKGQTTASNLMNDKNEEVLAAVKNVSILVK